MGEVPMKQYGFLSPLIIISFVLSGCFYSKTALIEPENGVRLVIPGQYRAISYEEDGSISDENEWIGPVRYEEGRLHSDVEDMPLEGAVFAEIAERIYMAQGQPDDGDEYIILLVFDHGDGRYFAHLPMCERLPETSRETLGLIEHSNDTCEVRDGEQARAAMLEYVALLGAQIRDGVLLVRTD